MKMTLSDQDISFAKNIGRSRQAITSRRCADAYGFKGNGTLIHEQGAVAEFAVSKYLDLPWNALADDHRTIKADVGDNVQVRSTTHPAGRLLLHPKDPDDQFFFLVRLHAWPEIIIVGYIIGLVAKIKLNWINTGAWQKRPCYVVPSHVLQPPESFLDHVK